MCAYNNVTTFSGKNCFARANNLHIDALRLTERFTLVITEAIHTKVLRSEDPKTHPTKEALDAVYRRPEPNVQLIKYRADYDACSAPCSSTIRTAALAPQGDVDSVVPWAPS